MTLVAARGLAKHYGRAAALDGFDLTVEEGAIVGLIGPNGSGKTTAFRGITGLARLDDGELSVLGLDPYRQRAELMRQTAYIADVGTLPRWMKVRDLLQFVAGVHPAFDLAQAQATLAATDVQSSARVGARSPALVASWDTATRLPRKYPSPPSCRRPLSSCELAGGAVVMSRASERSICWSVMGTVLMAMVLWASV